MMAAFTHERGRIVEGNGEGDNAKRPGFSSMKTSDRLRESEFRPRMGSKIKSRRQSVFREEGLQDLSTTIHPSHPAYESNKSDSESSPTQDSKDFKASSDTTRTSTDTDTKDGSDASRTSIDSSRWFSKFIKGSQPMVKSSSTAPPGPLSSLPRVALITFLIAIVVPGFRYSSGNGHAMMGGADAGVIRTGELVDNGSVIEGRANSPTDVCRRWAHQSANVNGTLYIYGGQTLTSSSQTTDTWNNNLLALDLTKSWDKASPALSGLPQPSGPPAVAMGALWNSHTSLFVYGGYFSDSPPVDPLPVSVWEYDIGSSNWIEHKNPMTSAGNASEPEGQPIQRAAEGASLSVPEIGRSWYFGGHLDLHTTPGWSNQIYRVYLTSQLEFTHPGYANNGIYSLGDTKGAGVDGVYRNITHGGLQAEGPGFTERADGVLVYINGWGEQGILLGLAGGTNTTYTDMVTIDVYDIANSTWYKQPTVGDPPPIRVNPCAVVAAAPDGSSFSVYLYGGQNLIPAGQQIQYDDMYILTIPSFTWIKVDQDGTKPPGRAGHTCTLWDGQMVVVGGYVGQETICDSPGMYVFNTSSLQWTDSFTSLSDGATSKDDKQSSIAQGSFGYQVPEPVQSVIGGGSTGGASATQPAAGSATVGPIATGKPPTFTVTQSGSTVFATSTPTAGPNGRPLAEKSGSKTNIGAIVAGVAAAVLAALAAYLAFCTWLYRKQLNIYKDHVAMGQRRNLSPVPWGAAAGSKGQSEKAGAPGAMIGPFGTDISNSGSNSVGRPSVGSSNNTGAVGSSKRASSSNRTPSSNGPPADPALFGGGIMPGGGIAGKGYTYGAEPYIRLSEDQEFLQTQHSGAQTPYGRTSGSTTRSSAEDLLGGLEPSFFSVVWNPRRTLKVVNSD